MSVTVTHRAEPAAGDPQRDVLRRAVLLTLAYADVFDYPLSPEEIHRYLIGSPATLGQVGAMIETDTMLRERVERSDGWIHLPGRAEAVASRHARSEAAGRLWPIARRYASAIARLPLVRLAAVTGALAIDNADEGGDIDLFVLARPRRVWTCRLLVLVVVKLAARRGHRLCPNFVLSTDRMALAERNVFTAHEVVQMVPAGPTRWYDAFLEANSWTREPLPNARGTATGAARTGRAAALATMGAEAILASRPFDTLERWEMERKVRRLTARAEREGGSVAFTADECRGHFAAHDVRVLAAFAERAARATEGLP